MRILIALIAVFVVSGAVADSYTKSTKSGREDRKDICTGDDDDLNDVPGKKAPPIYTCKDPKTGKTQKVQCKKPPKQKIPDKVTLAELDEACSLRSDNRF